VSGVAIVATIGMGAMWIATGLIKATDIERFGLELDALGAPAAWRGRAALIGVAMLEVATGMLLSLSARLGGGLSALILLGYAVILMGLIRRGAQAPCACFGALAARRPVGARSIARNLVLASVSVALVVAGSESWGWALLIAIALAEAVVIVEQVIRRREEARFDGDALPAELFDPPAPYPIRGLQVQGADGTLVVLDDLLAGGRPLALVFVHAGCDGCAEVLGHAGHHGWIGETGAPVDVHVVGLGPAKDLSRLSADFDVPMLFEHRRNPVAQSVDVRMTPQLTVVGTNRVALSTVYGAEECLRLLQAIHEQAPVRAAPDGGT
jgi:hypothetical protein